MRNKHFLFASVLALLCGSSALHAQDFKLTSSGYFKNQGVDIMAFDDIYPAVLSRLLTPSHRIQPDDLPGPPPYIYGKRGKQR